MLGLPQFSRHSAMTRRRRRAAVQVEVFQAHRPPRRPFAWIASVLKPLLKLPRREASGAAVSDRKGSRKNHASKGTLQVQTTTSRFLHDSLQTFTNLSVAQAPQLCRRIRLDVGGESLPD